jgi:Glycosyltransferase family 87
VDTWNLPAGGPPREPVHDASAGGPVNPPLRELAFGPPWVTRAVVGGLILAVALVVGFAIGYRPFDFGVYRWGGQAVTQGMQLYRGHTDTSLFTYPPFAAVLLIAVVAVPDIAGRIGFELISLLALVCAAHTTLKLAGYRAPWQVLGGVVIIAMTLEPVYHTFFLGQINLILLALILADIWRVAQGRPAGLLIGIAAAIKLTPLIFVALLVAAGRTKAGLTAAVTFVVCGLLGYLATPGDSRMYWQHRLFTNTGRFGASYISNQSLYAAALRISGGAHVGHWFVIIPVLLGIAGLAIAGLLARAGDWLGAATTTGTTGLLVSPISWTHHWVWILPALVILVQGGRRCRIVAGCAYVLFVAAPLWFTPRSGGPGDYGFHWLVTLVANCYLVAGLALLGYMGWRAAGIVRGAGPHPPRAGLAEPEHAASPARDS